MKQEKSPYGFDNSLAKAARKRREREQERRRAQPSGRDQALIEQATRDPYTWVTEHTQTYNQHWFEEKRPSPYEPFPSRKNRPDLEAIFALLASEERILWLEKSRDMMESWCCVAYLTLNAMTVPERGVLFQCQKEEKARQLVKYARCLYSRQPQWLKDAFPLAKPLHSQPDLGLYFADGGYVAGIPGGADQMRSYHPWGVLNDESSFQPEAGECFNEYLSAVKGKILFNSSAGPGWYADARRDIVVSYE